MRRFFFMLIVSVLPLTGCMGLGSSGGGAAGNAAGGEAVVLQELEGQRWKAMTINGSTVKVFDMQAEPHLVFFDMTTAEPRLAGSDGCNRVMGGVNLADNKVAFGSLGTTMMACPQGFEQSRAFLDALSKTNGWNKSGDNLILREGSNVIMELAPVNLD